MRHLVDMQGRGSASKTGVKKVAFNFETIEQLNKKIAEISSLVTYTRNFLNQ